MIRDTFFLLFFDQHSARLTERARQVSREQAERYLRFDGKSAVLSGHTDASETGRRDRGLGARRAQAVAAFLAGSGVPAERITVKDLAGSRPLLPNVPGVAEPQNREVSGVFDFDLPGPDERRDCAAWVRRSHCEAPANAAAADDCRAALPRAVVAPFPDP